MNKYREGFNNWVRNYFNKIEGLGDYLTKDVRDLDRKDLMLVLSPFLVATGLRNPKLSYSQELKNKQSEFIKDFEAFKKESDIFRNPEKIKNAEVEERIKNVKYFIDIGNTRVIIFNYQGEQYEIDLWLKDSEEGDKKLSIGLDIHDVDGNGDYDAVFWNKIESGRTYELLQRKMIDIPGPNTLVLGPFYFYDGEGDNGIFQSGGYLNSGHDLTHVPDEKYGIKPFQNVGKALRERIKKHENKEKSRYKSHQNKMLK